MQNFLTKYGTKDLTYKTKTDSQTCNRLVVAMGEGVLRRDGLGVWGQQMQITIYRMDKQQCPTVKQGCCIQYPVINHTRKEYEKD